LHEPEQAKWDSEYGQGRPGWHIECSAMACQLLGESFDIHGGGADLQFPHHENEIAQSEGATGKPMARIWMHNGFVTRDNEKMSKSLGNFFTIREVLASYDAETVRFFILRAHYRSPLNYSDRHLDDARASLKRLYTALSLVSPLSEPIDWSNRHAAKFKAAMDEDFGTPEAVAALFELAGEVNRSKSASLAGLLKALGGILGLLQTDPQARLQGKSHSVSHDETGTMQSWPVGAKSTPEESFIAQRIEERALAKAQRNFAEADRIRKELAEQGILLKDSAQGTTWEAVR
jgi:cysteinyl-tRNA synthetase